MLTDYLKRLHVILIQVLEGLHYLHTKCQIIHTDIKPENVLVCVDEAHIKRIAAEATQHQKLGIKLPGSAMSTAPKELRKVDLSAKMSKSKKKKLKKREKRNQALMEEAMQHVMETEPKIEAKILNGEAEVGQESEAPKEQDNSTKVEEEVKEAGEKVVEKEKKEVEEKEEESKPDEKEEQAEGLVNGTHHAAEEESLQVKMFKNIVSWTEQACLSFLNLTNKKFDIQSCSRLSLNPSANQRRWSLLQKRRKQRWNFVVKYKYKHKYK